MESGGDQRAISAFGGSLALLRREVGKLGIKSPTFSVIPDNKSVMTSRVGVLPPLHEFCQHLAVAHVSFLVVPWEGTRFGWDHAFCYSKTMSVSPVAIASVVARM